jgi:hypothetical protein
MRRGRKTSGRLMPVATWADDRLVGTRRVGAAAVWVQATTLLPDPPVHAATARLHPPAAAVVRPCGLDHFLWHPAKRS